MPACLFGLLTVACADQLRTQITAMDDVLHKAFMNKDISAFAGAMRGHVTADFKYYDNPTAKPMGFDQMVSGIKMGFSQMSEMVSEQSKLLNVKMSGNTATAYTVHYMSYKSVDKQKKVHTGTFSGVSIDTYKNVGGAWKMASMAWKSQEIKSDGHRIKM